MDTLVLIIVVYIVGTTVNQVFPNILSNQISKWLDNRPLASKAKKLSVLRNNRNRIILDTSSDRKLIANILVRGLLGLALTVWGLGAAIFSILSISITNVTDGVIEATMLFTITIFSIMAALTLFGSSILYTNLAGYVTRTIGIREYLQVTDKRIEELSKEYFNAHSHTNFTIISATYGTSERYLDVTDVLNKHVSLGRLSISVSNDIFGGDPAPGQVKSLEVTYFHLSRTQTAVFPEGNEMILPPEST